MFWWPGRHVFIDQSRVGYSLQAGEAACTGNNEIRSHVCMIFVFVYFTFNCMILFSKL